MSVARGTTYPWPAYTRDGVGALVDADTLQVEVRDAGNVVQDGFPQTLAGTIVHDGTGQYHVPWEIPVDQDPGTYYAYWTGTADGNDISGTDSVEVTVAAVVLEETGGLSYLTPERLRTLPLGVSWTGWSDLEIAELINDASAEVHAYCNVPLEGSFSFLGGSVAEEHTWRLPDNPFDTGQTRIYPRVMNIISVDSVQLQLSANTYQTIPASSFVVNNVEGWLELSALVLNPGIFGISFFIFPLAALEKPVVRVNLTYGKTWDRVRERMYPTESGGRTYQAPDGFWLNDPELTGAGIEIDPGDYTVDRASGQVTFTEEADLPLAPVVASYTTRLDREIAKATGFISRYLASKTRGPGRLLLGGAASVKAGEISISRAIPRGIVGGGNVIEDLAHDVPEAARMLNGHRFFRIA